jgi:hypothetical protein
MTEHLYLIYVLHSAGKIDLDQFWNAIFATHGIFDATPYGASLKGE